MFNTADFNQTTHKDVELIMKDMMRGCELLVAAMKQSGHHCSDAWSYCNAGVLKIRQGTSMPSHPTYYLHHVCKNHQGIDGCFAQILDEALQSTSMETPADTPDCRTGSSVVTATGSTSSLTAGSTGKSKEVILQTIAKTSEDLKLTQQQAAKQRQALLDLQTEKAKADAKTAEEERCRHMWDEYFQLSERVLQMVDRPGAERLLKNLARRVLSLETELKIPREDSVVADHLED